MRRKLEEINEFKGDYRFLSNFYPSPFVYDSRQWATVEHAFQALKSVDKAEQERIRLAVSPNKAKGMGRQVKMRSDWDSIKVNVMTQLVAEKFKQNPDLCEKLLATGEAYLEEGNYWRDDFWGVYEGRGKNKLGIILMKVRKLLRQRRGEYEIS
jgi:ribA/ribD-fused uncharacterized protein